MIMILRYEVPKARVAQEFINEDKMVKIRISGLFRLN